MADSAGGEEDDPPYRASPGETTVSSEFPKLPRPDLTEEILSAVLDEVRKDGWQVFKDDHDHFVIQTDKNRQVLLEVHGG